MIIIARQFPILVDESMYSLGYPWERSLAFIIICNSHKSLETLWRWLEFKWLLRFWANGSMEYIQVANSPLWSPLDYSLYRLVSGLTLLEVNQNINSMTTVCRFGLSALPVSPRNLCKWMTRWQLRSTHMLRILDYILYPGWMAKALSSLFCNGFNIDTEGFSRCTW